MKKILKKCLCIILVMCSIFTKMMFEIPVVDAAITSSDKYSVSYDSSKYTIFWITREKINCYSQYGSMWGDLDKGDKLGSATLRFYYLEPKSKTDGSYYAKAGCQISMDPTSVAGDVSGMSQLAKIGIKTPNADSRVCSPTVGILNVQKTKSVDSSGSFTAGTGIEYDYSTDSWIASSNTSFTGGWSSVSSYTYNSSNVNLIQKNKDNGYATWKYDYISKDGNLTWNAYLFSSSKVAGQVVYALDSKPTSSNRNDNLPSKISYDVRFGAGDETNGKVANRLGFSTNREMSIVADTISISY